MASPALKAFDRSFYEDLNDMRIQIGLPPINYHFDVLQDDMLTRTIFIKIRHQTYYISSKELNQIFSGFGTMDEVVVFGYRDGFHSKICFHNRELTIRAFELLNGRNVYDDCCKLELFLVKDYCPEPMKSDSGCALQTRQLIPNSETQAPPPSPIVQSGEMMRPMMDSKEESDGLLTGILVSNTSYSSQADAILAPPPSPPTLLPSPMVDIPAPLPSTETPAPLPPTDVRVPVNSPIPIQETMEQSFFSQIEAERGNNRPSRTDFRFFDELIPKLSQLVYQFKDWVDESCETPMSYFSNSSAHQMFDEMSDGEFYIRLSLISLPTARLLVCHGNRIFDPGGVSFYDGLHCLLMIVAADIVFHCLVVLAVGKKKWCHYIQAIANSVQFSLD